MGTVHPTNGLVNPVAPVMSSGADGNVLFDGVATVLGLAPSSSVYTLTRDIWPDNLTVSAGVSIKTAGFCIYVKNQVLNLGTIQFNGNPGIGITAGASFTNQGTLYMAGGAGGAGRNTTGAGNGGAGSGGNNIARSSGGNGGQADAGNAAGAGNATAQPAAAAGDILDLSFGTRRRLLTNVTLSLPNGGGGGGGGSVNVGTGTATSGAGGGAGGGVLLTCAILINSGTISANGGNGGTAVGTGNALAGGGGGGSGGWVWVAAGRIVSRGTITALGGIAGTSFGSVQIAPANGTAGVVVVLEGS